MCATVYGWRHLVKAMEVTAGLVRNNSCLLPGGWLKVTCGLPAGALGSAPDSTIGNEYQKTIPLPFFGSYAVVSRAITECNCYMQHAAI